jgi:hypothetical protein
VGRLPEKITAGFGTRRVDATDIISALLERRRIATRQDEVFHRYVERTQLVAHTCDAFTSNYAFPQG